MWWRRSVIQILSYLILLKGKGKGKGKGRVGEVRGRGKARGCLPKTPSFNKVDREEGGEVQNSYFCWHTIDTILLLPLL